MKLSSRWILWAALTALLIVPGCRGKSAPDAAPADQEPEHAAAPRTFVTLTPAAMAAADIKTEPAMTRALGRRITAPGEVEFNARRLAHLTARTAGRVERVFAVKGDRVSQGQVLAEVYSSDYMAIQAEYLQAAERAKRLAGDPAEAGPSRALLEAARERLLLVGAAAADVDALEASRAPRPLLVIRASLAGTVLESGVLSGAHVELGTSLFRLADLSTLWACLHLQERDLESVKAGAAVDLRTQAYPGRTFRGRLVLVGDVVDPATRTVEGRVEIPNPEGKLKAGMYVEASLAAAGERTGLAVPESSVQDDEGRAVVFVKTGERTFTLRGVSVGERAAGWVEIVEGLSEGEQVVTSGAFLLESELRKGGLEDEHGHD
jgi:RND family efflux transporter MFP subunit